MAWIRACGGAKAKPASLSGLLKHVTLNSYLSDGVTTYNAAGSPTTITVPNVITVVYSASDKWNITPLYNCVVALSNGNNYTINAGQTVLVTCIPNGDTGVAITFV